MLDIVSGQEPENANCLTAHCHRRRADLDMLDGSVAQVSDVDRLVGARVNVVDQLVAAGKCLSIERFDLIVCLQTGALCRRVWIYAFDDVGWRVWNPDRDGDVREDDMRRATS